MHLVMKLFYQQNLTPSRVSRKRLIISIGVNSKSQLLAQTDKFDNDQILITD